jgi:hypothetical protein
MPSVYTISGARRKKRRRKKRKRPLTASQKRMKAAAKVCKRRAHAGRISYRNCMRDELST